MATTTILAYLDWGKEFHVHVDASNYTIGATLAQTGNHGLDHPVYFASQLLSKVEKNYNGTGGLRNGVHSTEVPTLLAGNTICVLCRPLGSTLSYK